MYKEVRTYQYTLDVYMEDDGTYVTEDRHHDDAWFDTIETVQLTEEEAEEWR